MATDLLTLNEALSALTLKDTDAARDALLQDSFLPGVRDVIEEEVGWVEPRTVTIEVTSRGGAAVLPRTNVRTLVSATDLWGNVSDISAAVVASDLGIAYGLPDGILRLELEVGFTSIPEAIRRAAAEVLIVSWETQRSNQDPRPFLLPYRAEAWLKPYSMGPGVR